MPVQFESEPDRPVRYWLIRLLVCAVLAPVPCASQDTTFGTQTLSTLPPTVLPRLGSLRDDQLRVAQLSGDSATAGYLLRSPSALLSEPQGAGARWQFLLPDLKAVWNSDLPFSLNEEALWAGRGINVAMTFGARLLIGPVEVILAPELTYSQNLEFETIAPRDTARSAFASPWHIRSASADLPLRFGDATVAALNSGQSSIGLRASGVHLGLTTENEWWGPGIRNAIVMSNNASGIPRFFLTTDGPWTTSLGDFEARWIAGALSESLHFDRDEENDLRSLSGLVATYQPVWEPDLTLGASRVVYGAVPDLNSVAAHALDVITWWKQQVVMPDSTITDTTGAPDQIYSASDFLDREQILSIFGRWIFPDDGAEVYIEWARLALPTSLRDLLAEPQHSQGYTLGFQWTSEVRGERRLRIQGEATYLEESSTFNNRPVPSYYVSGGVPQGYTQRGRVIGASTGPGSSAQWLAADRLMPGWSLGAYVGRIRWDNDVYYRGINRLEVGHDVSIYGGLRGFTRIAGFELAAELARVSRLNYLFQNPSLEPKGRHAVDRGSWNLRMRLSF
jgi:hypothetical protein